MDFAWYRASGFVCKFMALFEKRTTSKSACAIILFIGLTSAHVLYWSHYFHVFPKYT